ncbi:MAG TPA: 30S ribosomal protein S6 [Fimbriimonadaceae bacterium]|nr:30S ribosomal protein S6 [Fimbriimonadaceae bacterium]
MNERQYEAIYIVAPDKTDSEVKSISDRFKEVVEKNGGTVDSAGKWEKRKLAYEIAGHTDGNYVLMDFKCDTQVPKELSRLMRISDDVIRHRIYLKEA